jgi:hypothetical protein
MIKGKGIQGKRGTPNYIDIKTFTDFCSNQKELINILNHKMSSIEVNLGVIKNDVGWTKKLLWGILTVVIVSFFTIIIKSMTGL